MAVLQLSGAYTCMLAQPLHITTGGGFTGPWESATLPLLQTTCAESTIPAMSLSAGCVPCTLVALLEDPAVIKVGVGIQEDVRRLARDYGVHIKVRAGMHGLLGMC